MRLTVSKRLTANTRKSNTWDLHTAWKSNVSLFVFSLAAGFLVGSGCVVSSGPVDGVPEDFLFSVTEVQDRPLGGGRFVVGGSGVMEFDDWGAKGPGHVVYRDVWTAEEVGSAYNVLMDNSIRSLQSWEAGIKQDEFVAAPHTVVIETRMHNQTYKVYAIIDQDIDLSRSVTNIINWYHERTGVVRARASR
jgi:hypothetical protein